MKVDRVIEFYDSALMNLDTATTLFVPTGVTDAEAIERVKRTKAYKKLNDTNLGDTDAGIRGDVGIATWSLPAEIDVNALLTLA